MSRVQSSTDYNQFKLMRNNREPTRGHIESIKRAFEEQGNFMEINPILVNEKFEIIDGQHRYVACVELGLPVYYTMGQGLNINDARAINILHKQWISDDYAHSYAESGIDSYVKYLQLREDYGESHSIVICYANPNGIGRVFKNFREGDFEIEDYVATVERLDKLQSLRKLFPQIKNDKNLGFAVLALLRSDNYDHAVMLRKAIAHGENLRKMGSITEYQRALEDLYNHGRQNRIRLY